MLASAVPLPGGPDHMEVPLAFWFIFNLGILTLLILDLTVFHRKGHIASLGESILTTLGWVGLSVGFGLWILYQEGSHKSLEFFAGYMIEYSLSMDNIFLFILFFGSFKIGKEDQHQLLFYGILGAMLMRALMVFAGVKLLETFEWLTYLFGAYILYAGIKMLFNDHKDHDVEHMLVVRMARRYLPMSSLPAEGRYFVWQNGAFKLTLLALVLVVIECTDLVFALDSIPAVFGITRDPFMVYTSNICAILGLRSLYFLLAGAMKSLVYLHYGLAAVLAFIGLKMLGEKFVHVSVGVSLSVVALILFSTVVASLLKKPSTSSAQH